MHIVSWLGVWVTRWEYLGDTSQPTLPFLNKEDREVLEVMYPASTSATESNFYRPEDQRQKAIEYFKTEGIGLFDFCGCDRITCRGNAEKSGHFCVCGRR